MSRTALTPVPATGPFPTAGVLCTPVTMDSSNGNAIPMSGRDLVVIDNPDSASHTVTFHSVADSNGRLGDITTEAIAAGASKCYGPFGKQGWAQSGGILNVDCSSALLTVRVIQIP